MVKVGVGAKQVANALDEDRELAAEVEAAIRHAISQMNEIKVDPITLWSQTTRTTEADNAIAWDEVSGDAGHSELS